jgi:hypothetical protein
MNYQATVEQLQEIPATVIRELLDLELVYVGGGIGETSL